MHLDRLLPYILPPRRPGCACARAQPCLPVQKRTCKSLRLSSLILGCLWSAAAAKSSATSASATQCCNARSGLAGWVGQGGFSAGSSTVVNRMRPASDSQADFAGKDWRACQHPLYQLACSGSIKSTSCEQGSARHVPATTLFALTTASITSRAGGEGTAKAACTVRASGDNRTCCCRARSYNPTPFRAAWHTA